MEIDWKREAHIGIAVSGGVDSMVLLDKVRRSAHYSRLSILHVNHGLREQSIAEEQMIADYASRYDLPLYIARIPDGYFDHRPVQQAARDYRYHFFEQMRCRHHIEIVLTAHHQQDQMETVLFRLLTGRYHLQPVGIKNEQYYRRPLLDVKKQQLYQYADTFAVPFMEDSSNQSTYYTRNMIRNELLPLIEQHEVLRTDHLVEFVDWQRDALLLMEREAMRFMKEEGEQLNRERFNQLLPAVKHFVIKKWVEQHIAHHLPLKRDYMDEIIRVSMQQTAQASYPLNSLWSIEIVYDKLELKQHSEITSSLMITSPGKYTFNHYIIELTKPYHEAIVIRTPQPGDRIKINNHHQKVNRIMIDQKIPQYERLRLPIVEVEGEIVAVGHLKHNHHPVLKQMTIQFKGED